MSNPITTPESAAYALMLHIATAEKKDLMPGAVSSDMTRADRKWILNTYYQALLAVKLSHTYKVVRVDENVG